jgi:phosphoglycolate phosphatase-like HAD superfamily hydrolase
MLKAVIVDFDDTLCLTEEVCFELENACLAKMGRPPMPREIHKATWGQPLFDAIIERSPGVDIDRFKEVYAPLIRKFIDGGEFDAISQANLDALDSLIDQGLSIMLLTSRTHAELGHILEPDHALASRVQAFYYKDNTAYHKPDPRVFDELLHDHNLKPSECVYVGDSPSDALAAKQAGLHFIASLESGLRAKSEFNDLNVDYFTPTFAEVPKILADLGHDHADLQKRDLV